MGIDLDKHPVLDALVNGLEQLYELGCSFGYRQLPDGYISPCRKNNEFQELEPLHIHERI
ncbi:MAG: hypothetical protein ACYTE8_03910 [Planctomycetota bacterium]|jgi:hypothetical protein